MSQERFKHSRALTLICLGCTLVVMALYLTEESLYSWIGLPLRKYELGAQDWVSHLAKPAPVDSRLVFISVDAASHTLDTLWPDEIEASPALKLMKKRQWSREIYARTLDRLADAGARVVAFDYMFQDEDDADAIFRAALDRHRDVVVIGCQFEEPNRSSGKPMVSLSPPSETLIPVDQRVGFVNIWPDEDGITRRVLLQTSMGELSNNPADADPTTWESLATRMARQAGEAARLPQGHDPRLFRYAIHGEMLSRENKPRSLYEIFVPALWQANYADGAFLRDKIVLVGPEGRYNKDLAQSPSGVMAGPEFHLNALNAILLAQFLRESPLWIDLLLIATAGLLTWLGIRATARPLVRATLAALGAGAWIALTVTLYNASWVVPVLSPMLALLSSGFAFSIWEQVRDRQARQHMRRTLERYVSKDVVRELLDNPATYLHSLGGERKEITVLFSDVRGFTSRTESADPHELVTQLNEYFEAMVAIVFEHHGTLDKFIGDAVMAHWGSIVTEGAATDATRAVRTVLQMREALGKLNRSWVESGRKEMRVGFGINHGDAIVGNLGCEAKMEVSVIGDAVNLGSRLEGATKEYGIDICLGEGVAHLVRESFILRSVDLLVVKGKTQPVEIFTVLGERSSVEPPWLSRHEQAVRHYRSGDFTAAMTIWRDVLADVPGDPLANIFLERCVALRKNPPTAPWTGVYEMLTK